MTMRQYENASTGVLNLSDLIYQRLAAIEPVHTIKLQKLLYYCQAWSLTLRGRPMFPDQIQAWKHGPVVASLYRLHRGDPVVDESLGGSRELVPADDADFANAVLNAYGARSAWSLRDLTHEEAPWIDAWERSEHGRKRGEQITPDAMRGYYAGRRVPRPLVEFDQR